MFKNYFKTALRNLARRKNYTIINIAGLGAGIAICLVLFLVIRYEMSFDNYHQRKDRIYRVLTEYHHADSPDIFYGKGVPSPLPAALKTNFPQAERIAVVYSEGNDQIQVLDDNGQPVKKFKEEQGVFFTEPSLFDIFDFKWLAGSPASLNNLNSAVLTKTIAEKYFGDWQFAIGKTIKWNNQDPLKITGILADVPENTDLQFKVVVRFGTGSTARYTRSTDWDGTGTSYGCYVLLPANVSAASFNTQLRAFAKKMKSPENKDSHIIQPLSKIHYDTHTGDFSNRTISPALSNAIAGLLDGPVTIEDRGGGVLAFSARQDEADDSRIATILDRQVPADKLRDLEQRGAFHALYRSDDHIYIAGVGEKPRVAIAVRAGGEILGSIWVVVPGPLNDDRAQAFREAANVAALHLLRRRSGADADRRLRADLLATVLEGGPQAARAAARLGLAAQRACVLAVAVAVAEGPGVGGGSGERTVGSAEHGAGDRGAAADLAAAEDRLAGALALHLSAIHPHTAVASLGSVTYAVLPVASEEDARRVIEGFLARAGARIPICVAIGRCADRATDLRRSRTDADRALRVLQSRTASPAHDPHAPHRITRLSDVYVASLLDELADRMAADDDIPSGPVVRLRDHDRRHGTAFTATLAAWLDALGDVNTAAAKVHVHPNTFRYRLRRLADVAGLNLSDPDARFEAMVQLRLMPSER